VASELQETSAAEIAIAARSVTPSQRATLLAAVLIISICALTYELIVATLSSYLLGDSVTQFSITIGFFLFAMGLGALLSRRIRGDEPLWFVIVELLTGFFGGISAAALYAAYTAFSDYYYPIMIGLILAIGVCIGLEIPLLMRIVAHRADLSKALADVLSVDYIGALIASLAFPLVMLPLFGVTQTAFWMGLFNISVAAICLQVFRARLRRRWRLRLWLLTFGIGALMLTGGILSTDIVRLFERQLYEDVIIYREQSSYQRIVITRGGEDVRLFLDGNLQFSSRDEHRYHEMLVHPAMMAARNRETVVILGGGDGLAAREVLKYPDVQRVVVVDLDPAITTLAQTFPLLRQLNGNAFADPRLVVINMDAYEFIERSDAVYPVVIIDLPDPNNESLSKLYSQQFYRLLARRLSPDGAFITQATSPYFAREAFWCIVNTIRAADFQVLPLRAHVPSFGEWGFVLGTPRLTPTVRLPDRLPLRYLTPAVLESARVFDPDMAELPTAVNTLDNPVLVRYYSRAWQQWN
jgi:spermidine synthase